MTAVVLSGKEVANQIKDEIKGAINCYGFDIRLTVIQVGDDSASNTYIRNKEKACEYVGIKSNVIKLPEHTDQNTIMGIIKALNKSDDVTGIMVQLPLPKGLDEREILNCIDPRKDVDGLGVHNAGEILLSGKNVNPLLASCTPRGIMSILDYYNIDVDGKECVVVGRSNIVGKPMALMLLNRNGTVTVCHSNTKNLKKICKRADILVCAIGVPKFFTKEYVKDGAVVIDVGIHRMDSGGLCGDVAFDDVKETAGYITPVPGGVGLTTVATLADNCLRAHLDNSVDVKCKKR